MPTNMNMSEEFKCDQCDSCGGQKTYENQVMMPLKHRVRGIDYCIHHIVAALNAGGIETTASCCGHGVMQGHISLADGRDLIIADRVRVNGVVQMPSLVYPTPRKEVT